MVVVFGKAKTVGKAVRKEDITEFYYTYATSTNPPDYQRYRFYTEGGAFLFYHEKREGDHWPLTVEDVTVSGTVKLTGAQWDAFYELLDGGTVKKREEHLESGYAGPWLYLYWNGDGASWQEFTFESYGKGLAFEEYCRKLAVGECAESPVEKTTPLAGKAKQRI